jgi:arabinan endo-1,5-alpha-L-arabinosidase
MVFFMRRRDFLRGSGAGLAATLVGGWPSAWAQDADDPASLPLTGAIRNVHDPVMIRHGEYYYLFCTGVGIPMRRSPDLLDWKVARGGTVFQALPEEAAAHVPGADSLWAPDIAWYNGRYHLYYSVSTFGSNRSAIGLATNTTLDFDDDAYAWVDHGIVVSTDAGDDYNAIDANFVLDADGAPWLAFGSHWSGIKLIRLDAETGKQSAEDATLYALAARAEHPRAIEAPFIIWREPYYYLFVSFDQCCQGINSTYNVRVGRAEAITGPYLDRDGVPMLEDGGTLILEGRDRWRGPGHNAIFSDGDGEARADYIVYHSYDTVQGGTPTLRIDRLTWDEAGWPSVPGGVEA